MLDRRLLAVWAAMFLNVLPFIGIPVLFPMPAVVGQVIAQGALPLAFLLALAANPADWCAPMPTSCCCPRCAWWR